MIAMDTRFRPIGSAWGRLIERVAATHSLRGRLRAGGLHDEARRISDAAECAAFGGAAEDAAFWAEHARLSDIADLARGAA